MVDCEKHLHITDITKEKTERPTGALVQKKNVFEAECGIDGNKRPSDTSTWVLVPPFWALLSLVEW